MFDYKNAEKILEAEDVVVKFNLRGKTLTAIRGISMELYKGESLAIVGESGSGKSVFTKTFMGLLDQNGWVDSGSIIYSGGKYTGKGVDLVPMKTEKEWLNIRGKEIAMVFQDPMTSLNPTLTVGDQIGEVIKFHEMGLNHKQIDDKVCQILEMVGIPAGRRDEYPHQFSGGMKQRVVIAIALACKPQLLLADEPTTALDVTIQAQVLALMKELKKKFNTAMLLITHDLGIVAQTCDKVAVMYAGEIIEQGTLEDIFTGDKHHPYTVGLFGAIPNISDESERLKPIDGLMPDPTDLPIGCSFFPRCPHCMERCKAEKAAIYVNGTHSICCHLFDQEVKE